MKKTLLLGITAGVMVMFSGCATIMSGNTQTISIHSNSKDRIALSVKYSDGVYIEPKILTPSVISVKKSNKSIIFKPLTNKCEQKSLQPKGNGWVFGNILIGGLIGSTTDAISGAAWKYDKAININCSE